MNDFQAFGLGLTLLGFILLVRGVSRRPQFWRWRAGKLIIGTCCVLLGWATFVDRAAPDLPPTAQSTGSSRGNTLQQAAPHSFATREAFAATQRAAGFVVLGSFDDNWPAAIVGEKTARDSISLVLPNGTRHAYPGYTGYELKAVRLKSVRGEFVMVLRSAQQQ